MSKKSRAQKKRSREKEHASVAPATEVESALSKTQKRKLQKKRQKEAAAMERAAATAAAPAPSAPAADKGTSPAPAGAGSAGLCVVYEDTHMIAISKPAGMLAHGSKSAMERGTVVHALGGRQRLDGYSPIEAHMLEARESYTGEADSFIPRAIVHRLDRGTTGLMMVAKSTLAEAQLAEHFKRRTTHKRYVALLSGWPDPNAPGASVEVGDSGGEYDATLGGERIRVSVPIARDPERPGKMRAAVGDTAGHGGGGRAAVRDAGKEAHSLIYVHAYTHEYGGVCLCSVDLLTGRQHQIRVHCSHLGAPLLHDEAYGRADTNAVRGAAGSSSSAAAEAALGPFAKGRQLLHAWSMDVPRPNAQGNGDAGSTGWLRLRAPLPDDMRMAIARLWPNLVVRAHDGPHVWPRLSPRDGPAAPS